MHVVKVRRFEFFDRSIFFAKHFDYGSHRLVVTKWLRWIKTEKEIIGIFQRLAVRVPSPLTENTQGLFLVFAEKGNGFGKSPDKVEDTGPVFPS